MRYETVELVRYGRYAGRRLEFPRRDCDFHLVLGGNEAGKSTLRQAFHDLLFGIPMNTPMAFLHQGADLELKAVVSGERGELAFGRRRKRNAGLVDARGEPLAPEVLLRWLGEVGPAFYERMFGLDHRRLEHGARAMLEAADNVDSVLFQAAAGVSALNGVLERLRAEADALWGPRRSRERAWYVAAGRLDDALSDLKASTVRPSRWHELQRECSRLEEAFARAESAHRELLHRKRELERLRRSAPLLAQIRRYEVLLAGHESDGGDDLSQVLALQKEIQAADETRALMIEYRRGIADLAARMDLLGGQLADIFRQLGRPAPQLHVGQQSGLEAGLPARPLLRRIAQLLQRGRELEAQRRRSRDALEERRHERERLQCETAGLAAVPVGQDLRAAVEAVNAAGDLESAMAAARRQCERQAQVLERRLRSLARPGLDVSADTGVAVEWLEQMNPWPSAALAELVQQRQRLHGEVETGERRLGEARLKAQEAALKLEQFRRSRRAVSRDEVLAARRERDALWQALHGGRASLAEDGDRLGLLIQHADHVVDLHVQTVEDAAQLQLLEHENERCALGVRGQEEMLASAEQALAAFDDGWQEACASRGLPPMPPAEMQGWLAAREAVLAAAENLDIANKEAVALQQRHDALFGVLRVALGRVCEVEAVDLATLAAARDRASTLLHEAERVQARRQALDEQLTRVESQLPALEREHAQLEADVDAWRADWQQAIADAALPAGADDAYVEAALELFESADELFGQLRECAGERRRMMESLDDYVRSVGRLAAGLGDESQEDVDALVRRWVARLEQARAAERERGEARRRLEELNERLLQEGEGRSRQEMEAALQGVDVSTLAIQSEKLDAALEEAAATSNRLAVERQQARSALEAVSGGSEAAQAEARRQEALADMAEIAERYVHLHAQQRLLGRVMEWYRDRKQGPLLARAGEIFADLTLGAYAGLVVEVDEKLLHARRADGFLVPLDGLSDGTRDQLYLALRLAALELYLDNATPLPFIADDLFINYDDRRAMAGLRRLGEVAQRTQVIFLTHHAHMVELAQTVLGGRMNLIELPQPE